MSIVNRRSFLRSSAVATVASAPLLTGSAHILAGPRKLAPLGVQLYTVRNLMKIDPRSTLAKIAAIGYTEVEFAGYFNLSPKEARAAVDSAGLAAPSNHIDYKALTTAFPQALESAHTAGHKFLVNSWIDEDVRNRPDAWKRVADSFNRAGETARQSGIHFAYHNYWYDFKPLPDGKLPYDLLLQECDPKLVVMEMDICWAIVGGIDPVAYFDRYPARFRLVHLKDLKKLPKPTVREGGEITADQVTPVMTEVGSGAIDWKRILAHSEQAGMEHYLVEHDEAVDAIATLQKSFAYLDSTRF
jgi:sugar phosphate isomerase/epimerase